MSAGGAILFLAVIWATIHILYRVWNRRAARTILPAYLGSSAYPGRSTKVSLNALQLKVSTSKWNIYHDRLSTLLAKKGKRNAGILLRMVYNFGTVFGSVGMMVAFGGLMWMCASSAGALYQKFSAENAPQPYETHRLIRRGQERTRHTMPTGSALYTGSPSIIPIIPGVTVPLGDFPLIILAVFFSQIVHELGHAIAAASESLPMISAGLSFTVCIPAAFVTFPTSGMKNLSAKAQSRIIAAGPFHNLVFWCFLLLVAHFKVVSLVSVISGYYNASDIGKVVVAVSEDSPLSLHLLPGSIITKLDDETLAHTDDLWTQYLMGQPKSTSLGWCVTQLVLGKSDSCCTLVNNKVSPLACFESLDHSKRGCLDPVPLLTKPSGHGRCSSSKDCDEQSACVTPHEEEKLLRLTVRPSELDSIEEKVVLWSGPGREIWEEVQVGNWLPRLRLLPLQLPGLLTKFWNYLMMATLSLYLFNLLPLSHLDGSELLQSLLDLTFAESQEAMMYDIDALETGEQHLESSRSQQRWKRRFMRYAPVFTAGLVASCIVFAVINMIY